MAALIVLCPDVYVAAGGPTGLAGEHGTAWTTSRELNNVTAFDAETGAVVDVVAVGTSPVAVVAPARTGKVYSADEETAIVASAIRTAFFGNR